MVILRNLTSGAPWASRFYHLDPTTGASTGVRKQGPSDQVVGLGSKLLTTSNGRLAWRFLALYLDRDQWMVFDGERETRVDAVTATWKAGPSLGGIGLASLMLKRPDSVTITYVRPWLRQWFEGGWTSTDVDIAWVLPRCINDGDARDRLRRSFDAGQYKHA